VGSKNSAALFAQAMALRKQGKVQKALDLYRKLTRAEPRHVGVHTQLGILLGQVGKLTEGEQTLRRALTWSPADPGVRQALAMNLMAQGQYVEGWSLYESRHELPAFALPTATAFPFPQWRGEPLAGKRIAIFPEQGFGDQIQFARFVPRLQAAGAEVTLLCPPELAALFAHSFPGANVVAAVGSVEFPDPDFWTMAGGVVGRLGATLETLPSEPYLSAPAGPPPLPAGFKIGVQLRGNPGHANDANRSLPADMAAALRAQLPGHVIGLEPAETGARDFAQTAAIVEGLDLVVTVDTSVAHLAGAMGKPGLVLLPDLGTDWRWLRDREDSPWYPSLRLYRRAPRDTSWAPTIERLVQDVQARASAG
jgi:hypothetical protein